jgi:hypothetical protein
MAPRKLIAQPIYLEPGKADLLNTLAASTRIPKAALLREAVDDLLAKHGATKAPKSLKKSPGEKPGK